MKRWIKDLRRQGGWLIKGLIFSAVVGIILYITQPDISESSARYILSAISQGLAAIMALVITIVMIIGQLTDPLFLHQLARKKETKAIILIFVIGIIAPLIIMKFIMEFQGWCIWINIAIALAVFCLSSLYFFWHKVTEYMLISKDKIVSLEAEGFHYAKEGNEAGVIKIIRNLTYTTIAALKSKKAGVAKNGVIAFRDVYKEIKPKTPYFCGYSTDRLIEIGKEAIERENGDVLYRVVWDGFQTVGEDLAKESFWGVYRSWIRELKTITLKAIGKGIDDMNFLPVPDLIRNVGVRGIEAGAATEAHNALGRIGKAAIGKSLKTYEMLVRKVCTGLWLIAAAGSGKAGGDTSGTIDELKNLINRLPEDKREDFVRESFESALGFQKRYGLKFEEVLKQVKENFEDLLRRTQSLN